jgi:hypothetical protein
MLSTFHSAVVPPLAGGTPAGGSPTDQIVMATGAAVLITSGLLALCIGHRSGRIGVLGRLAAFSEKASGLPGWAALPNGVSMVSLLVALLGMYWDISLHIDQGRDPGPLANPAHYLILAGLFGVFASGVLAIAIPLNEKPGRAAVRITRDWYAPVGGVMMAACGAFALIGFPLDDMFHRLFGQDVTLWGPTHLMLIGGAAMSLIGQAVLLAEGMRARKGDGVGPTGVGRFSVNPGAITRLRRVGLMGGLLIGLSTFQAEFDFGVPQYRAIFQPMLIALAAGFALVAARQWIGRGGAIGAVLFYLVVRGAISLLVGPVFGETTPALPLYLGEAALVEVAALLFIRRPLVLGAVSGVLIGTVGLALEWPWTHLIFKLPWTTDILPEAVILSVIMGVAGGLAGALLGMGLRGELPSPRVGRLAVAGSMVAVAACVAYGLHQTQPTNARAIVTTTDAPSHGGHRYVNATVRVTPKTLADNGSWIQATAWQGNGLQVDKLRRVGPGVYRTTRPLPAYGEWKSLIRVHKSDYELAAPIFMPGDSAIPVKEVPAAPAFTRPFQRDTKVLQRERKKDIPPALWGAASGLVLLLYVAILAALAWGVSRFGRAYPRTPDRGQEEAAAEPSRRRPFGGPTPTHA